MSPPMLNILFAMRNLVVLSMCYAVASAVPNVYEDGVVADTCTADICQASDGCRCSTSQSPLTDDQEVPQLISLTFDQIMVDSEFNLWKSLLSGRNNPDGLPIGATFFISHEYTDYTTVNRLYNLGFEIGVNSITKSPLATYWPRADEELLKKEFGGQKQIINKFANIPLDDIIGARTPYQQLAGNNTIKAYIASGLSYDSTWSTLTAKPLYPYTLDYLSTQECNWGSKCPNEAFNGFWILPINDLHGFEDKDCNTLASCNITGTADEIADWLINEIDLVRNSTRVPLTLLLHSYWFELAENSLEGFKKFLDKMATYSDVFLVTQKQVYDWIKNSVPLSEFQTDFPERNAACTAYNCKLKKPDGDDRYLNACIPCPSSYPWLDNPDGN